MKQKHTAKVTVEMDGETVATFDYADIITGSCQIGYNPKLKELSREILRGCIEHIDSMDDDKNKAMH